MQLGDHVYCVAIAFQMTELGCKGNMDSTSVTPLITRVDSADLAGEAGVPFLPHQSMCIPPKAACLVEEDDLPTYRRGPVFSQAYTSSCAPLLEPPNKLKMAEPVEQ